MAKLYLLTQTVNNGYDTYDSCVVCANSAEEARRIRPNGRDEWPEFDWAWAGDPENVTVKYIGEAAGSCDPGTVILASFNEG